MRVQKLKEIVDIPWRGKTSLTMASVSNFHIRDSPGSQLNFLPLNFKTTADSPLLTCQFRFVISVHGGDLRVKDEIKTYDSIYHMIVATKRSHQLNSEPSACLIKASDSSHSNCKSTPATKKIAWTRRKGCMNMEGN